jgi:hypothetical protein
MREDDAALDVHGDLLSINRRILTLLLFIRLV